MKVCSEEDIVVDMVELVVVGQIFENGRDEVVQPS
jgi:hypothetical protein